MRGEHRRTVVRACLTQRWRIPALRAAQLVAEWLELDVRAADESLK